MWILRDEGEPISGCPARAFFLASGTTVVGRQVAHGTLALTQDPSISRKHAEIIVGPLDVDSSVEDEPILQLRDLSRFGTQINGSVIGSGNTCAVKSGDVIQFGHKTKLRLAWDRVVLCLPAEDAAVQQQAAALGFHGHQSWSDDCTHLVLGQAPGLTAAAACASATSKPIVHTKWLDACMRASTAEVKEMPPPCEPFLLAVTLPRDLTGRLPPADAHGAAPTAVHAPLQGWTLVWHPGTEDPQLRQAAALAGSSTAAAGNPALAAAAGGRLLHVVPGAAAAQAAAHQPTITADCLLAAIIDGRPAALQALLVAPKQPESAAMPAGQTWRQPPQKRAAGAALAGRAIKKLRRGRGRSPQTDAAEDAEDAMFNPGNDAAQQHSGAEAMDTVEHTVVVANIISTPSQPQQLATPAGSGSPNFKCFRKQVSSEGRQPLIPFAATSYAREVGAQEFLRAEKQAQKESRAADDLFAAKLKTNKAKTRK